MKDDNRFIILFGSIKKRIYKILNEEVKKYNLSIMEVTYLMIINSYKDGITFKQLTNEADCDKGMTTKVTASLKNKDLIYFDGSEYLVTDEGKAMSLKLNNVIIRYKNRLISLVGKESLEKFYYNLNKFNEILDKELDNE